MKYWLFKSERECFSWEDLNASVDQTTSWDGVRNYQARNFMRDQMKVGDLGFFYHSGKKPEIVGVVRIVREGYADFTAWDPENGHYDPASTPENPRWMMVDVQAVKAFTHGVQRTALRGIPELGAMELMQKGSRLSVQPVTEAEFNYIMTHFMPEGLDA